MENTLKSIKIIKIMNIQLFINLNNLFQVQDIIIKPVGSEA